MILISIKNIYLCVSADDSTKYVESIKCTRSYFPNAVTSHSPKITGLAGIPKKRKRKKVLPKQNKFPSQDITKCVKKYK